MSGTLNLLFCTSGSISIHPSQDTPAYGLFLASSFL